MPQHKSCKKRIKTSTEERARNRADRSNLHKALKNIHASTTKADAEPKLNDVLGMIDRAAQKHIIHKNKAARDKSKLMKFVSSLS